jgi:hypothetical protein
MEINDKFKQLKNADWQSGIRIQLMHFKSLPFKEKIKIVEDMESMIVFFKQKKQKRVSA